MLKVRNLRWNLNEGGMCCGPAPESGIVEICFETRNGSTVFVSVSEYDCSEQVMIADRALFEYLADQEWETANAIASLVLDFDKSDREAIETGIAGESENAIKLARLALKALLDSEGSADANDFIAEYINTDVDELDIPLVCLYDEWEEEEEEEEEGVELMERTKQVTVLERASLKGYRAEEYPVAECAIREADRAWSGISQQEKAEYDLFRVSKGVFIMTTGGPLFVADEVIRDYLK